MRLKINYSVYSHKELKYQFSHSVYFLSSCEILKLVFFYYIFLQKTITALFSREIVYCAQWYKILWNFPRSIFFALENVFKRSIAKHWNCINLLSFASLQAKKKYSFSNCFISELELGTQCVVEMEGQQTILHNVTNMDKMDR